MEGRVLFEEFNEKLKEDRKMKHRREMELEKEELKLV